MAAAWEEGAFGDDIDCRDKRGNSMLIVAAQNGNKRIIKFLLRNGADINAANEVGNTALHFAHTYSFQKVIDYLHRKGADDTIKNKVGLTCYEGLVAEDNNAFLNQKRMMGLSVNEL